MAPRKLAAEAATPPTTNYPVIREKALVALAEEYAAGAAEKNRLEKRLKVIKPVLEAAMGGAPMATAGKRILTQGEVAAVPGVPAKTITAKMVGEVIRRRTAGLATPPRGALTTGKLRDPHYASAEWRALRGAALERDGHRCTVPGCTARAVVVDHIVSRRRAGGDRLANLRSLCRPHDNQDKEDRNGARRNGGLLTIQGCDASGRPLWTPPTPGTAASGCPRPAAGRGPGVGEGRKSDPPGGSTGREALFA